MEEKRKPQLQNAGEAEAEVEAGEEVEVEAEEEEEEKLLVGLRRQQEDQPLEQQIN